MGVLDWLREQLGNLLEDGVVLDPDHPPSSCPIGWQPGPLTPVFYGYEDHGPLDDPPVVMARAIGGVRPTLETGPPTPLRIFYPSLDGSVAGADVLAGCGRYPLIAFCHGNCAEAEHYKRWYEIAATLARCGYVVVVPHLPGIGAGSHPSGADTDLELLTDSLRWVRTTWLHRDVLLPDEGIVGHSFGALLAGRYAAGAPAPVAAYASLSGEWHDWSGPPRPIDSLTMPRAFFQGSGELTQPLPDSMWARLPPQKHRVTFRDAGHWDYLPPGRTSCEQDRGPCDLVRWLTADLLVTFFGRYLPPEHWGTLPGKIPASLVPPPVSLTPEQEFYGGSHLGSFARLRDVAGCSVRLEWVASEMTSGSVTRP